VYHVDGRKVDFQIEAREQGRLIARGLHKRAVVRVDNFARELRK
jgi:predicted thioesterase